MIEATDIDDIEVTNSWYDLLKQIPERENKVSGIKGKIKLRNNDKQFKDETIENLSIKMKEMFKVYFNKYKWQDELEKALYSDDFRSIYHEFYLWYKCSIIKDVKIVKDINSLVLKSDNSINAVEAISEELFVEFLRKRYRRWTQC